MHFWQGKKVFLTGHTGFKGSWLSLWLNMLKAEVTGYSFEAEKQSFFTEARIADHLTSITGDIRNLQYLAETLQSCQPEIVMHLAAQSLVRPSYIDPATTFATNVIGTVNVLEAVRRSTSVKAVIIVTSDKCYENNEWVWGYREQDPMGGYDPYSASKGCSELVSNAYRRSFFQKGETALATVRSGNVIGGGDWSLDRLVPDIIRAVSSGKEVLVRNPTAIRPWQHVCEPLQGYLMLAEMLCTKGDEYAEAWNFGPDDEGAKPVSWIVDYVCSKWGKGAHWCLDKSENPHEANYLKLECSKAKAGIGWRPRLGLSTALDWTVEWYREILNGADAKKMTEQQIVRYQDLCNDE